MKKNVDEKNETFSVTTFTTMFPMVVNERVGKLTVQKSAMEPID